MTKLKLLGAAAVVLSSALATPVMAQQMMSNPGRCSQLHPNADCQKLGRNHADNGDYQRHVAYRNGTNWNDRNWNNGSWDNGWNDHRDTGFWPGDVAADVVNGAVGTAGAVVGTAGAIAAAPFEGDSYAYYNGNMNGWDNGWDNGWNNGYHQTYAQRNGFVCQPGTWFKGDDGRQHVCQ